MEHSSSKPQHTTANLSTGSFIHTLNLLRIAFRTAALDLWKKLDAILCARFDSISDGFPVVSSQIEFVVLWQVLRVSVVREHSRGINYHVSCEKK